MKYSIHQHGYNAQVAILGGRMAFRRTALGLVSAVSAKLLAATSFAAADGSSGSPAAVSVVASVKENKGKQTEKWASCTGHSVLAIWCLTLRVT